MLERLGWQQFQRQTQSRRVVGTRPEATEQWALRRRGGWGVGRWPWGRGRGRGRLWRRGLGRGRCWALWRGGRRRRVLRLRRRGVSLARLARLHPVQGSRRGDWRSGPVPTQQNPMRHCDIGTVHLRPGNSPRLCAQPGQQAVGSHGKGQSTCGILVKARFEGCLLCFVHTLHVQARPQPLDQPLHKPFGRSPHVDQKPGRGGWLGLRATQRRSGTQATNNRGCWGQWGEVPSVPPPLPPSPLPTHPSAHLPVARTWWRPAGFGSVARPEGTRNGCQGERPLWCSWGYPMKLAPRLAARRPPGRMSVVGTPLSPCVAHCSEHAPVGPAGGG